MESVALLEARVAGFERERGQDSSNSSKPPSSDGVAPRKKRAVKRAEQRSVGRSAGKQPGTPGKNHAKRVPDVIVASSPVCCSGCGSDMGDAPVVGSEVRQVIELIPARISVTDHVVEKRRCGCGKVQGAVFEPPWIHRRL